MTPRRRSVFRQMHRYDGFPSTSVIRDAQHWQHRLAFPFFDVVLPWFLCDDYHPLFLAVWSSAALSRRQTWPNHDNLRRLTIKAPDVRRGYRPVVIHIRFFHALQAFNCSICFQSPYFRRNARRFALLGWASPMFVRSKRNCLLEYLLENCST